MSLKQFIIQKTLGLFVKTNGALSRYLYGGLGHVFMLHRVLPAELNPWKQNKDLAITPEDLEACIQYFIRHQYEFISIDELHKRLAQKNSKKKFVCITLDDGYKDNLLYGLPVFEKYNIPVTIYITTCFPNHTALLWWYWLEEKIDHSDTINFDLSEANDTKVPCSSDLDKMAAFHSIRNVILNLPGNIFRQTLLAYFEKTDAVIEKEVAAIALSWAEIIELSKHPLITIGAHTVNHQALSKLDEIAFETEIAQSRTALEQAIAKKVEHFAYPYGSKNEASEREYAFIKRLGFKTAVLNQSGNIFSCHNDHTECLPRMGLINDPQRLSDIINGIHHFANNPFKKCVR